MMLRSSQFIQDLGLKTYTTSTRTQWDLHAADLNRPGLQFVGFYEYFAYERPQVVGLVEMSYLESLSEDVLHDRLDRFFSYPIPCVIVCRSIAPPDIMLELARKHNVTVLGTGDIGTEYAMKVRACGASHITGINRSGHAAGDFYDETAGMADIDRYLPLTDILFMCLPGTPETTGILSEERIASMKKTAVIVNVGRGSAIDQKALISALNEGRIFGAALDVFEKEPLPEGDPAWHTPGLLVTTHTAGNMTAAVTRRRNVEQFLENLEAYSQGLPLKHVVRKNLGY